MAFDSLFVGVSGLEAYQSQIDTISNNIANVGTTGFKGQAVNFQDLIYQAQSFATSPTQTSGGINGQDLGLGVKIGSIDTRFAQGGLTTTGVNTNLAMNGDGFFILRAPNGNSAPVYTRNGDFSLNQNGLLYDGSSGMAVQGYLADKSGNITQTGVPGDITIPLGLTSQAVGTGLNSKLKFGASGDQVFDVSLGGNLDQTQWIKEAQGVQNGAAGTGSPYTISTTIYDSLGNGHLAQVTYTPDATGATGGNANIAANSALGGGGNLVTTATGSTGGNTISITVNAAGTLATISDGSRSTTGAAGAVVPFDGANITLGNFVAADANKTAIVNNAGGTNGLPAQVADANGNLHAPAARWKVSTSFADGTTFDTISNAGAVVGGNVAAPTFQTASSGVVGYAYFDQNGQYINTAATIGAQGAAPGGTLSGAAVHGANQATTIANGNQLNIRSWGTGTSNASFPTAPGVAPATGPIGLDFHLSSALAGTSSANVISQNGFATGILSNLTVGQDGTISGAFTNGQTTTLGRVAVAVFQNEGGLQRVGSSDFSATANSGLAQVGTASVGRFGQIIAGSLESSNVSIADEFTKMIAAQNAYQANSKSITVASEDMQTVTQLIR